MSVQGETPGSHTKFPHIGFNIQHKSSLEENQTVAADSLAEQTCAHYSLPYPTGLIPQSSLDQVQAMTNLPICCICGTFLSLVIDNGNV